jgi:hypothetical protein
MVQATEMREFKPSSENEISQTNLQLCGFLGMASGYYYEGRMADGY